MDNLIFLLIASGIIAFGIYQFIQMDRLGGGTVDMQDKIFELLEQYGYSRYGSKAIDIATYISKYSVEMNIDWKLLTAILGVESGFDVYAMGDFVEKDYYGEDRYTSFGLGQINTRKDSTLEWNTFDFICEYSKYTSIVKRYNLDLQRYRDNEVLKASDGDTKSLLFDIHLNIFLVSKYIRLIMNKYKLDKTDYKRISFHYNMGINADEKYIDSWLLTGYYKKVMDIIKSLE